ncbi:MAG: hypothetical protein WCF90_09290, partial [Methanomicrobiales archaeon]
MDDPYLSSDESLILSAHGIRIDGKSLDLMLTSRRLILIENFVTPFQLHTIPLETIITVFAGTDAKGEPIFTLSYMDITGSGAPQPMDIIFIRQKGEPRVKECNEWAETLSGQASRARDDALAAGTLPYDPVKVIQPRMSATYRIETFSPRRPAIGEYPLKVEPPSRPPLPESETEDRISAVMDKLTSPVEAEWVEPSELLPNEYPVQEEPLLPETEISSVGESISLTKVTDVVMCSTDRVQLEDEISEEIPVPSSVPTVSETPLEQNPESGTDAARAELPVESSEIPCISDVQRIWADAARSIVSPAAIPMIVIHDASYPGEVAAKETVSAAAEIGIIPDKPAEKRRESIAPAEAGIPASLAINNPFESIPPQFPLKSAPEIAGVTVADSFTARNNQKRSFSP